MSKMVEDAKAPKAAAIVKRRPTSTPCKLRRRKKTTIAHTKNGRFHRITLVP
jgi:hypothetical protein